MLKRVLITIAVLCAFAAPVFAQDVSPLSVQDIRQSPDGVDRLFAFTIGNALDQTVVAHGSIVLIDVYSISLPVELSVDDVTVPAHGTTDVTVRWHDAPLVGQVHALITLSVGSGSPMSASHDFWLLPNLLSFGFLLLGFLLLILSLALVRWLMRKPKTIRKPRPPANMLLYIVEPDDTIVTLSARFEVSWQDLVHANRLKPPYAITPGAKLLIPRHPLKARPVTKA